MKKYIVKAKSYTPLVKKKNFEALKNSFNNIEADNTTLRNRNDDWANEVRNLRLEIQRLKEYEKWLALYYPNINIIKEQREQANDFAYRPLISIILPVYNTNLDYLRVCIDSVIGQSYTNWQLCITDDASTSQPTIDLLQSYDNKEPRINLKTRKENGHISVASNDSISRAEGDFIALLDHDDYLWPNALFEVVKLLQEQPEADLIYSDEDKIDSDSDKFIHFSPYFKPDWSPHLLECINYITHFSVLRTDLVRKIGGFDRHLIGAQDWDLFLRLSESSSKIYHIPNILYSWRSHDNSTAQSLDSKNYALNNQKTVLENHFSRLNKSVELVLEENNHFWYPKYAIKGKPKVSIIIPTKDKKDYLERCVASIINKTTYKNYEIIIVDTGSEEEISIAYLNHLKLNFKNKIRIKYWKEKPFNYSDACNFGAKYASGDYLLMLNNDTEVITDSWIEDMLGYAQQKNIGAVGAKLLFPNKQIQHAGVTVGIGSLKPVAGHSGTGIDINSPDLLAMTYTNTVRDVMVVTAACLMIKKEVFWKVEGFDPIFRVTFNDVDLNLKLVDAGFVNIYLPFVNLFHHESVSIGKVFKNRDMKELDDSAKLIRAKWKKVLDKDKFYNKNFYILSPNFGLDIYTDSKNDQ